MLPIIIPVRTTRTVDCIIQEGIRYCEKQPVNLRELGIVTIIVILWGVALIYIFIELDKPLYGLLWILAPFILMLFL